MAWIYFLVMLGGALGTGLRFGLSTLVAGWIGEAFPWGTLFINITGSFVIGFFATLTDPEGIWMVRPDARVFFMVGICGGYTTFSAYSLQTLRLAQNGQWSYAVGNVIASNVGCLVAVWLGYLGATVLTRK